MNEVTVAWNTGHGSVHLELEHAATAPARSVSARISAYARKHYPGWIRVSSGGALHGDGTASTTVVYAKPLEG